LNDKLFKNSNSLKYNLLFIIVHVSASTEAFVGTVCLIAVHHITKEQDKLMNIDEGSYQFSHIYDILFAPKLSGERLLDRPFQRRLQSRRQQ